MAGDSRASSEPVASGNSTDELRNLVRAIMFSWLPVANGMIQMQRVIREKDYVFCSLILVGAVVLWWLNLLWTAIIIFCLWKFISNQQNNTDKPKSEIIEKTLRELFRVTNNPNIKPIDEINIFYWISSDLTKLFDNAHTIIKKRANIIIGGLIIAPILCTIFSNVGMLLLSAQLFLLLIVAYFIICFVAPTSKLHYSTLFEKQINYFYTHLFVDKTALPRAPSQDFSRMQLLDSINQKWETYHFFYEDELLYFKSSPEGEVVGTIGLSKFHKPKQLGEFETQFIFSLTDEEMNIFYIKSTSVEQMQYWFEIIERCILEEFTYTEAHVEEYSADIYNFSPDLMHTVNPSQPLDDIAHSICSDLLQRRNPVTREWESNMFSLQGNYLIKHVFERPENNEFLTLSDAKVFTAECGYLFKVVNSTEQWELLSESNEKRHKWLCAIFYMKNRFHLKAIENSQVQDTIEAESQRAIENKDDAKNDDSNKQYLLKDVTNEIHRGWLIVNVPSMALSEVKSEKEEEKEEEQDSDTSGEKQFFVLQADGVLLSFSSSDAENASFIECLTLNQFVFTSDLDKFSFDIRQKPSGNSSSSNSEPCYRFTAESRPEIVNWAKYISVMCKEQPDPVPHRPRIIDAVQSMRAPEVREWRETTSLSQSSDIVSHLSITDPSKSQYDSTSSSEDEAEEEPKPLRKLSLGSTKSASTSSLLSTQQQTTTRVSQTTEEYPSMMKLSREDIEGVGKHLAPHEITNPIKQGFLVKRGEKVKGWRKRFFLLKPTKLFYFRSLKDKHYSGVIDLSQCKQACKVNMGKKESGVHSNFVFVIPNIVTNREYFMACETEEELTDWVGSINQCLDTLSGTHSNASPSSFSTSKSTDRAYCKMSGYVLKRKKQLVSNWNRRFFVLRDGILKSYESHTEKDPRNVWMLAKIETEPVVHMKDKYCFTFTINKNKSADKNPSYLLGFSTEDQAQAWFNVIREAQHLMASEQRNRQKTWEKSQSQFVRNDSTSFLASRKP